MRPLAALLILLSQLLLLWVTFDPTGRSASYFSMVGHPLLAVGCGLGLIALARRPHADERRKG